MIDRMDREIGRILKALKKLGLEEDTLVVFSSDHGATFETGNKGTSNFHDSNHPFRGQKRTLWEGGIRVPGIVRWPGQVPSRLISHDLVHMTDLLPTFLAAAGQQPDPAWKVDGRNLLPVWRGKERSPDRTLFGEWRAELDLFTNPEMRSKSENILLDVQSRYEDLSATMEQSDTMAAPVLRGFQDYVTFFNHNLNTRAIATLEDTYEDFSMRLEDLYAALNASVDVSEALVKALID